MTEFNNEENFNHDHDHHDHDHDHDHHDHDHDHDHHDHDHDHEKEYITIIDEDNNESLYEILFTFDSDEFKKSYVVVYPAGDFDDEESDDVELQAFSFVEDEDGNSGDLQSIESDEEWEMVEEVLNTFFEDEDL